MNFSKKFLRVVSLVLMVLILIPGMPSFAATFKDVNSSHWAYSYIEKMAKEGYIKGDPSGTFRPEGNLTYLETLAFVSRLIKVTETEKQTMKQRYQTVVTLNGVPSWAQEAVMICLLKGVISEAELAEAESNGMLKTGTKKMIGRLVTSIYLAKAMELDKVTVNVSNVQIYKDLEPKHDAYKNLLYLLINAGVLSPEGMGNYEFKPLNPVTRAQMAKMISTAYDYLEKVPPVVTPKPEPVVTTEVINGVLTKITNLGTNTFLSVKPKASTEIAYLVDSKTTIKLDSKTTTISSLFEGQDIKITITKGTNTALSVEADSVEEEITGTIKSITPASNKVIVEYTKDKATKTAELTVSKNADITLDGIDADLYDLKIGDEVNLFIENNVVIELDATAKSGEVEGVIVDLGEEVVSKETVYFITIENSKGVKTEYELDEDVSIYKDGRRADFEDLKLGDMAYIELEYGLAIEVDAEVVEKEIEGYIVGITNRLNSRTELIVMNNETNKEEPYAIAKNADIIIDDKGSTISNLLTGYYVELVVAGDEIIEIEADSIGSESYISGKISSRIAKDGSFSMNVLTSDMPNFVGKDISVYTDSKTMVIDRSVYKIVDIDDLERGNNISVFGYYDGYDFIASEIRLIR